MAAKLPKARGRTVQALPPDAGPSVPPLDIISSVRRIPRFAALTAQQASTRPTEP